MSVPVTLLFMRYPYINGVCEVAEGEIQTIAITSVYVLLHTLLKVRRSVVAPEMQ